MKNIHEYVSFMIKMNRNIFDWRICLTQIKLIKSSETLTKLYIILTNVKWLKLSRKNSATKLISCCVICWKKKTSITNQISNKQNLHIYHVLSNPPRLPSVVTISNIKLHTFIRSAGGFSFDILCIT